ncbi:MAG TPA: putative toxin-antitoxin system toxin component, PIN family [Spirochaetia bacterium]|nr:putative toxin-antitoxin system toxin component, PIN family [Spirochaetia bacterium]
MRYHVLVTVTLDTNVLYQALYSASGASHAVLWRIRSGEIRLALSIPVFEEYQDVLHRQKTKRELGLSSDDIQNVLDFIVLIGMETSTSYLWRPNLKDEDDNIFVELAVASGSEYLITRNTRDYTIGNELRFDSFQVVTPNEFMIEWRKTHHE